MEVSEALKVLRSELDMTQLELANALGVTHRSVSRWELGNSFPQVTKADAIVKLARAKGATARCVRSLQSSLSGNRKKTIRVPKSKLYPVDRESICDLVDGSHNAIYVCDFKTDEMLYANRKAEEYAGVTFKTGQKCYQFLYGRNTPCLQCPKTAMLEEGSSSFHLVSPKDGRHFLFRGRKLSWNGKPAHVQYFFEETTALEGEAGYRMLINELGVGVCIFWVHDDGHVEMNYMSDGYFSLVGSTREKRMKFAGYGVMNAVCKEDQPRVRRTVCAAAKAQKSQNIRYHILLDDGARKEFLLRARFIKREKEKSLYYCTVEEVDNKQN